MNNTDRAMLTELADLTARYLDLPRPLVVRSPVDSPEQFDAWMTAYKQNNAAYESLMRERVARVQAWMRHLATHQFAELSTKSITEQVAEQVAGPLPYPVAPEDEAR